MSNQEVDLFVIGAGSGGVRAARVAASHGARVGIAEEYRIGGTCVIRGCVPKKLMVYAARVPRELRDGTGFGWTAESVRFDWSVLTGNVARELARLEGLYAKTLDAAGVSLFRARAHLRDSHTIVLSTGDLVRAKHVLIATGAAPVRAAVPGAEHAITSDDVFSLPQQPERIVIYGGGYIAVEMACVFAGLGSQVTLVCRSANILRGFDHEVRDLVRSEMAANGVTIVADQLITGIERAEDGILTVGLVGCNSVKADQVLFAIGRSPNSANLGLQQAAVATEADTGAIKVGQGGRTSCQHIFAVGDVTNRVCLTPVAIREGHAFADTIFGDRAWQVDYQSIPTAVFSEPEVGTVGLSEERAKQEFDDIKIFKTSFRPMKATLSLRDSKVMMKLIVDAKTDRLLGCHIVGPEAAEMVQLMTIPIQQGMTKAVLDQALPLHPTAAEELITMRSPFARHIRA